MAKEFFDADDNRKYVSYSALEQDALSCTRCDLSQTRTNVVFCDGEVSAKVMVVGEAPGANEDATGKPFIGRGGQLLMRLFSEVGIERKDIYIANVIKCRPPENRNPLASEIRRCGAFLSSQIAFVKPKVIVPVGNFATRYVLDTKEGITKLRGQSFTKQNSVIVPTVHPAFVLRNGMRAQEDMRQDLKMVKKVLDGEI